VVGLTEPGTLESQGIAWSEQPSIDKVMDRHALTVEQIRRRPTSRHPCGSVTLPDITQMVGERQSRARAGPLIHWAEARIAAGPVPTLVRRA
jgi:hypothetical protein